MSMELLSVASSSGRWRPQCLEKIVPFDPLLVPLAERGAQKAEMDAESVVCGPVLRRNSAARRSAPTRHKKSASSSLSLRLPDEQLPVRLAIKNAREGAFATKGPLMPKRLKKVKKHPGVAEKPARLSRMEQKSVRLATRKDYERRSAEFLEFAGRGSLENFRDNSLDRELVDYIDHLEEENLRAGEGEKVVAAVKWLDPRFSERGGQTKLPRSARALRGFRLAKPNHSRNPLPYEWFCAIIAVLLGWKEVTVALSLLVLWDTYTRPVEIRKARVEDLIPPVHTRKELQKWSLTLAPEEREEFTKTGQQDDTLTLDELDLPYCHLLPLLLGKRGPKEFLFNITAAQQKEIFEEASAAAGLKEFALSIYQTRHGGASQDAVTQRREMDRIQRRGRWQSKRSVKRYEKHGRLQKLLHKTPLQSQPFVQEATRSLAEWLRGWPCPAPRSLGPLLPKRRER